MPNLSRFALTAVLAVACTSPAYAVSKASFVASGYSDAARTRLVQSISDAKSELVADASARADQVHVLSAAQAALIDDIAQADKARDGYARLNAAAVELRREAYEISNMPGLSASQNHKSVASMEAADAAENAARTAQFFVSAKAAVVVYDRTALDHAATAIATLDQRIAACDQLVKLNGAALEYASRSATTFVR
jgi:hypothetical protein